MRSSAYHERTWEALPEGLQVREAKLRGAFLLAHASPGMRALDVGCGEGHFAERLIAAGLSVVAIDVAEEPLRRARRRLPGLDARLIECGAQWPLADAEFDLLWAGEVLQHVADIAAWLSEARRVLRPQGVLLISVPNRSRPRMLAMLLSGRRAAALLDPLGDELHHVSARSLRRLLGDFGFECCAVGAAGRARSLLLASAIRGRW